MGADLSAGVVHSVLQREGAFRLDFPRKEDIAARILSDAAPDTGQTFDYTRPHFFRERVALFLLIFPDIIPSNFL